MTLLVDDPSLVYQWQYSDDDTATWNDVIPGGYYSGEDARTLSLSLVDEDINEYYYRLQIVNPALVCMDTLYSNAAMLTAKDDSDDDEVTK